MPEDPREVPFKNEIDQDDAWTVIKAYFKQHGLVSQQISSFNRFINISLQEIIHENGEILIEVQPQYLVSKCRIELTPL